MENELLFYDESQDTFIWEGNFDTKDLPKSAGFQWDRDDRHWITQSATIAARLSTYASTTLQKKLEKEANDPNVLLHKSKDGKTFYWNGGYDTKDAPKEAGFKWNKKKRQWEIGSSVIAAKLINYANPELKKDLQAVLDERVGNVEASRKADLDVDLTAPDGLEYLPFQKAGISYALNRPSTLFGDEMGLGKTIQALGVINQDKTLKKILVVCPTSVMSNWEREARKWLVREFSIGQARKDFPETDIVIVGYSRLYKHATTLRSKEWDLIVADECFPAGTLVDTNQGRLPIENIVNERKPVSALSCAITDKGLRYEYKPITRYIRKREPEKLIRINHSGGTLTCTGNHKIHVEGKGYTPAEEINHGEKLRILSPTKKEGAQEILLEKVLRRGKKEKVGFDMPTVRKNTHSETVRKNEKILFTSLLRSITEKAKDSAMRMVRDFIQPEIAHKTPILQQVLLGKVENKTISTINGRTETHQHQSRDESPWEIKPPSKRAHEATQFRPRISRQTGHYFEESKREKLDREARRERIPDKAAREVAQGAETAGNSDGIRDTNSESNWPIRVFTSMLQSGFGNTGEKVSHRDRRENAQDEKMEAPRQEKGICTRSVRVESVEVLERRSRQGFGDGFVYNIEVAGNHNYFTDGILVGNCHAMKNRKSQRAKGLLGFYAKQEKDRTEPVKARRKLALSGTPILNRPVEMHTVLAWLNPEEFGNFWHFANKYCLDSEGRFTGAQNLDELQEQLRSSVMIRRLKKEVLTELPDKRRQMIIFENNTVLEEEQELIRDHEETMTQKVAELESMRMDATDEQYEATARELQGLFDVSFTEYAKIRHKTAIAKAPQSAEHCSSLLDGGVEKLVVFAHHHDVIRILEDQFKDYGLVKLTGQTPVPERQEIVDKFQSDPNCRVFLGSIRAAGEGLTLTVADTVVFAELDLVPGKMKQAEDRLHRIGQKNAVLVQHLTIQNSLDERLANILIEKQRIADAALDDDFDPTEPIPAIEWVKPELKAKVKRITERRERINSFQEKLTPEITEIIHQGLKTLSAMCDGARELDGYGFGKFDTEWGKTLASQDSLTPKQAACGWELARKYRKQIPDIYQQLEE